MRDLLLPTSNAGSGSYEMPMHSAAAAMTIMSDSSSAIYSGADGKALVS